MDEKHSDEKLRKAAGEYEAIERELAPFLAPKPVKPIWSTAGQWRAHPATQTQGASCLRTGRCQREL